MPYCLQKKNCWSCGNGISNQGPQIQIKVGKERPKRPNGNSQRRQESWYTFFKVMRKIQIVLDLGYLMEPIVVEDDLRRGVRNVTHGQKRGFSKERSWHAFSRLREKFYVFFTPKESGYLMETIEVKNDHRWGVRTVQNCQKCDSQRRLQSCPLSKLWKSGPTEFF